MSMIGSCVSCGIDPIPPTQCIREKACNSVNPWNQPPMSFYDPGWRQKAWYDQQKHCFRPDTILPTSYSDPQSKCSLLLESKKQLCLFPYQRPFM